MSQIESLANRNGTRANGLLYSDSCERGASDAPHYRRPPAHQPTFLSQKESRIEPASPLFSTPSSAMMQPATRTLHVAFPPVPNACPSREYASPSEQYARLPKDRAWSRSQRKGMPSAARRSKWLGAFCRFALGRVGDASTVAGLKERRRGEKAKRFRGNREIESQIVSG